MNFVASLLQYHFLLKITIKMFSFKAKILSNGGNSKLIFKTFFF